MSAAAAIRWGGHDAAVEASGEVPVLDWDGTKRVRVRLLEAMDSHKPLVVFGPRGAGKTFSVARACEYYLEHGNAACQVAYLRIPTADRGRGLYRSILGQILEHPTPQRATETELLFDLAYVVCERERILVIDEAHRLSTRTMDALQNLIDVPGTKATFVLIGAPTMPQALLPELWSRAQAKVQFRPLADDNVAAFLAGLHPVFANTDPQLLVRMNRAHAKGELRYWVAVLGRLLRYHDSVGDRIEARHVGVLTEDL